MRKNGTEYGKQGSISAAAYVESVKVKEADPNLVALVTVRYPALKGLSLAYQNPKAANGQGDIFYLREKSNTYTQIPAGDILKREGNVLVYKSGKNFAAMDIRSGFEFYTSGIPYKEQWFPQHYAMLAKTLPNLQDLLDIKLQEYGLTPRYAQAQMPTFSGKTTPNTGKVEKSGAFPVRLGAPVSAASMAGKVSVLELKKYRTPEEQAAIDARKLKDTIIEQRGNLADIRKMRAKILELSQDLTRRRASATTTAQKKDATEKYKRDSKEFFQRENAYVEAFRKSSPEARKYTKTQIVQLAIANFQNFPVPAPKLSITQTTSTRRAKRGGNQPTAKMVDMRKALRQLRDAYDEHETDQEALQKAQAQATTKAQRQKIEYQIMERKQRFEAWAATLSDNYRYASKTDETNNQVLGLALRLKKRK